MSEALELKFAETLARDALAHEFDRLGLAFSTLHPTIRAVMERTMVSSGKLDSRSRDFCWWPEWPTNTTSQTLRNGMSWKRRTSGSARIPGSFWVRTLGNARRTILGSRPFCRSPM